MTFATMRRDQASHQQMMNLAMFAFLAMAVMFIMTSPAFAGTDTTFDTAYNKFTAFLQGSGGKLITLVSLAGGVLGMVKGGFSLAQVGIPVGTGVAVGTGVPIVTSTVTALI